MRVHILSLRVLHVQICPFSIAQSSALTSSLTISKLKQRRFDIREVGIHGYNLDTVVIIGLWYLETDFSFENHDFIYFTCGCRKHTLFK